MTLEQYIANINQAYKRGTATEHTYRGDLKQLLESIVQDIIATNEPKRISCGAPDYVLTRKDIPFGFIEAKDVGDKDLSGIKKTGNKEQFDRYKSSLDNLIFTDYIDFHFYLYDVFITKIAIAEIVNGEIIALPENFTAFTNLIKNFCLHVGQTIKSSKKLAEMMASKARLLADIIELALTNDENKSEDSTLKDQMNAFKEILIHDISPKGFADVYAQTIAYGMFCARLHDPTLPTFSRQEAAELIPKSNPFLRKLFGYIAGPDIDDRIKWVVDSLVDIFLACNVAEILKSYGKSTKMEDPIIHFYETFLSEYDPKLRKAKGVWYTPKPVVNFIVRAVDDILKTEFDLPQGLADTSKTKIKVNLQGKIIEQEVHKVQILDPATGTGTFLAEVVKHIHKKFGGQQGIWSNYVETHLLPRLNGFELLMASYAMAHLQMDLLLTETGYKPTKDQRFRIYLTNSLEESHPDTGTLFANWLSSEANEANFIKRDSPVMCIIGNPPYSGISTNNGKWITDLIDDYKYIDGVHFNERKHWLNDDYVKFLRYGQHFIEKNGSGVLAFINPHGFLDNPTFRGMRWNLLKTYDKIYTIDLHGNAKKKEVSPDGSADVNVFDIMQGVSINIFIKTGKKKSTELGKVFHFDLYGKRDFKYDFLSDNSLNNIDFTLLNSNEPNYFFVPKSYNKYLEIYNNGFKINDLFINGVIGIQTGSDKTLTAPSDKQLLQLLENLYLTKVDLDYIKEYQYRPFETRYMFFMKSLNDNVYPNIKIPASYRSRYNTTKHLLHQNLALLIPRQIAENDYYHSFICKNIADACLISNKTKEQNQVFPLYLYPETNGQLSTEIDESRKPNLKPEIVALIAKGLGLEFIAEKPETRNPKPENNFAPIDILDYIYAVLHSPTYRETYKEFLKIDFPKIPYPSTKGLNPLETQEKFWQLVKLGAQLREIHLLESEVVENYSTQYPIDGNNEVTKPIFVISTQEKRKFSEAKSHKENPTESDSSLRQNDKTGRVYINETQYFDNVPEIAWNFYIGGYQPAQKWLKDRKEKTLDFDAIFHYQKIIVALTETDRLMKEIDKIEI